MLPIDPVHSFKFLLAAVAVTLAPGPDNLMVLSIGISKGKKEGIAFGIGCGLGCLSHTLLVAVGLSAMIKNSPLAFNLLCLAGSLYLIWLGVQSLKSQPMAWSETPVTVSGKTLGMYFLKGLFANAINPKVIIFFLSFLPYFFVDPVHRAGAQALQLGVIFTLQSVILFACLGYFSGFIGLWLKRYPTASVWLDRVAGVIFIVIGVSLPFSEHGFIRQMAGW